MLNNVNCKRMTSNFFFFFGFKDLATPQWNLNDFKFSQVAFMDSLRRK